MVSLWDICGRFIIMEWKTSVSYIFFLIILFMNVYRNKDRVTEKQKANAAKLTTHESTWRHPVFTALLQLFGRQEIFRNKTMENVKKVSKVKKN